jgi:hypothetical protein
VGRETNKQRRQKAAVTARDKAAIARAAQQRADQRRRAMVILGSIVAVVIVAVVIVVVAINRPTKASAASDRVALAPGVLQQVRDVSDATLSKVGKGNIIVPPAKVTGEPALTSGGKPEVLYIGAEFCPYCAVERWALYLALSKFGTFSNVGGVHSAADDGNYASLDFYHSTYTSKYITFTSIENVNRSSAVIQKPTSAENALWSKLDDGQPGYPFVSFGNKFDFTLHPPLDPTPLGSLDQAQIAAQLNTPSSKNAQVIDGGANYDIAAICAMTNNQPASVCSSSTITSLESQISA